jgi:hypothetical protein
MILTSTIWTEQVDFVSANQEFLLFVSCEFACQWQENALK